MDAEKCYDLIHPGYETIEMMRLVLPQCVSVTLEKTQRYMDQAGVSTEYIK